MNKVYVLPPNENWIVDRFVKEWNEDNADISVTDPRDADVIWLLADWCFDKIHRHLLAQKKVITSVHHIVEEKFDDIAKWNWRERDVITDVYHVFNQRTYDQVRRRTQKPIHLIHYWANQKIWYPTGEKSDLRKKHKLPVTAFIIGSFQRDSEGSNLLTPKFEKGPDLLATYVAHLVESHLHKHIVFSLAGWRRDYLLKVAIPNAMQKINARQIMIGGEWGGDEWRTDTSSLEVRFPNAAISATSPTQILSQPTINDLYQCCDLYPVTSRIEGGPQALIESGLLNIPVVSRHVGIAEQVLPSSAISDDIATAIPAIPNVEQWKIPNGYKPYRDLILSL